MRRLAVLVSCATLALAAVSADAADPSFRQGVAAGEMTTTSATLWTRAPRPGAVLLTVSTSTSVPVGRFAVRATHANDLTVQRVVRRLKAGTKYRYFFTQGKAKSAIGSFTTAPAAGVPASVRFAISGDADATPGPNGGPAFNRYEVYQRMRAEANHFNINLGDTIYSDSEVGGTPIARTVSAKWEKYRLGLGLPALWALRASAGLYSHWDDHEFINDFSRARARRRDLRRGCPGVPRLLAGLVLAGDGALPLRPLGQASRALLPRRALVPQREGHAGVRRRPRAHRTSGGA